MYNRSGSGRGDGGLFGFPPAITKLVLLNAAIFLVQTLNVLPNGLALVPHQVVTKGMVWQLVTYMFLHGGTWHIGLNMFYLVMFGGELERYWGSRDFTKYYFITGIGAGLLHIISSFIFGESHIPTIGASGAVFGVLLAYGMAFPQRQILLFFVVPISARTLVFIAAGAEIFFAVANPGDGVARFAHLGGMLTGYLYLKQETLLRKGKRAYSKARTQTSKTHDVGNTEEESRRRDEILDKITRDGPGSLTPEERRFLEEMGERGRRRRNRPD